MTKVATGSTLLLSQVQAVLDRLHTLADDNDSGIIQQISDRALDWQSASSQQKAMMCREALLPISRDVKRFLYGVALSISAKRMVKFGTSYGVSTIYFAAQQQRQRRRIGSRF